MTVFAEPRAAVQSSAGVLHYRVADLGHCVRTVLLDGRQGLEAGGKDCH
jgi:hypothetical protein